MKPPYLNTATSKIDRLNLVFSLASLLLAAGATHAQLINGGFETGNLTAWTAFTDTNGEIGSPTVVLFDTVGTGTPSLSAQFEVGSTIGWVFGSPGSGGGISQSVNLLAGQLNISLNLASYNPTSLLNDDAGTFILMLDGRNVATNVLGSINAFTTKRSTLSYSRTVTAGAHQIAVDMRRNRTMYAGGPGGAPTPYQYLDNIVLTGSAVPSPTQLIIQPNGAVVILSWTNTAYALQTAPSPNGAYTNITGAASPYTNSSSATAQYFRLILN